MILKNYKNKLDRLVRDNFTLKFAVLILSVTVILLAFIVVSKTDSQRTVFIPPQNTYKEFWISGNEVSKSYLEMMGQFVAQNTLSITKDSADRTIANVLPLVHPRSYNTVLTDLKSMVKYIIDNSISRTFYASNVEIKNNQIVVSGAIVDIISSKVVSNNQLDFVVDYEIEFGMFKIINLNLIKH